MIEPTPSPTTPDTEARLRARLSNTSKALALLSELCPVNREEGEALGFLIGLIADYCGAEVSQ